MYIYHPGVFMSDAKQRKKWAIPPSFDVGVNYFYRNILSGSNYIQAYFREHIALIDSNYEKQFAKLAEGKLQSSERPKMANEVLNLIFVDAGIDKKTIKQCFRHFDHMAGGIGKPVDYLLVREFLAYAGITGIYDLKEKRHIPQKRKIEGNIPESIVPSRWRKSKNLDQVRLSLALMMDDTDRIGEIDNKILMLERAVWGEFNKTYRANIKINGTPDVEPLKEKYLEERPHLILMADQIKEANKERLTAMEELKDKYAPMDPGFTLPKIGIEQDMAWFEAGEEKIRLQKPFRIKFDSIMAEKGLKNGDKEYDAFNWQRIRTRAFSFYDWAIRDFTMSSANRGHLAESRRIAIPRAFVKAVREELDDGLLATLGFPYFIEPVSGADGKYAIIVNDLIADEFTLDQVLELERSLAEDDVKNNRSAPEPIPEPPKIVVTPMTPEQLAIHRRETEERVSKMLASHGFDGELIFHSELDPNPVATMRAREAREAEQNLLDNEVIEGVLVSEENKQDVIHPVEPIAESTLDDHPLDSPNTVSDAAVELSSESEVLDSVVLDLPATSQPSTSAPNSKEIDDEDLPFPGGGIAGLDDELVDEKDDVEAEKTDAVALKFNGVSPDIQPSSPSPSKLPVPANSTVAKEPVKENQASKLVQTSHDEAKKRFVESGKPGSRPMDGSSMPPRGMLPMGGGMPMGGKPMPLQNLNVDLGIGSLVRGIGTIGKAGLSMLSGSKVNAFSTTELLNERIGRVSALREVIASGVDASGNALSETAQVKAWSDMNRELAGLSSEMKSVQKLPKAAIDQDTLSSVKRATNELRRTDVLAAEQASRPGAVGQLAKEAQKLAERLAEALVKVVKAIMSLFSRDSTPSP